MNPEKIESISEAAIEILLPQKIKISLLPCFWANKLDFINNFLVRFSYEDAVTPSWFFSGNIYTTLSLWIKKFKFQKFCPCGFLCLQSVDKILRFCSWYGLWHLINFELDDSVCLIFAQTIVSHLYFIELTTLITI